MSQATFRSTLEIENQINRFQIIELLGKGTFGKVFLAYDNVNQRNVAIKRIPKWTDKASREATYLYSLKDSKNVVKLYQIIYTCTPSGIFIQNLVMEYIEEDLGNYLRTLKKSITKDSTQRIPPNILKSIANQICNGLSDLHAKQIAHRDLKPENILINFISSDQVVVKICDLGSSKRLDKKQRSVPYICSRWYRAPELLLGSTFYDISVDLWSLGCVLAELLLLRPMITGKANSNEKVDKIGRDEPYQIAEIIRFIGPPKSDELESIKMLTEEPLRSSLPELDKLKISPINLKQFLDQRGLLLPEEHGIVNLIENLLVWDPKRRLPVAQVMDHPFLKD